MLKDLNITKSTIFYILAPSNKFTGGPTLLHQLGFSLKKNFNYTVRMFYYGVSIDNPIHQNYKKYNLPVAIKIEDNPNNILISGEISQHLNLCINLKNIQKIMWWLSVDFFYISQKKLLIKKNLARRFLNYLNKRIIKKISEKLYLKIERLFEIKDLSKMLDSFNFKCHLCQSYYAYEHLKKNKIKNVYMLSDYLDDSFFSNKKYLGLKRKNIILYNPKKGVEITKLIINKLSNYEFKKIENFTPEEIIHLMKTSKIYIDFGEHPGKDRIPREAAYLGACIITGKKGSASNNIDISIPSIYKFDDYRINFHRLESLIDSIFKNFSYHTKNFSGYRNKIRNEKNTFNKELKFIFDNSIDHKQSNIG